MLIFFNTVNNVSIKTNAGKVHKINRFFIFINKLNFTNILKFSIPVFNKLNRFFNVLWDFVCFNPIVTCTNGNNTNIYTFCEYFVLLHNTINNVMQSSVSTYTYNISNPFFYNIFYNYTAMFGVFCKSILKIKIVSF